MSDSILRVENVTMQFGGVVAVDNLSFEVNDGEIVSIIGPNGAGKTTVFNAVTGVYEPTNGAIYYKDQLMLENHPRGKMVKLYKSENLGKYNKRVEKTPDEIAKLGIARTFQNIRLFKSMTVFENVLVAKHLRKKSNLFTATFKLNYKEEKKMREECLDLLRLVDLLDVKDEKATSLPYGKQRKLEIARALATQPKLLLLDEPAAGMNPHETKELMDTIRFVRDNFDVTILLIEHDMKLVSGICERLTVLNFGSVLVSGETKEVLNNPEVIKAYLGD